MNEGKDIFKSEKICEETWLIQGEGSNSYLVVGSERGILIDTGFSTENIREYVQSLTDKPVEMAANTHEHFDHTGGNGWFKGTYMASEAVEAAKIPYSSMDASKFILDYPVYEIAEGDIINLGERDLEVFKIPSHAPGSVAFLDRKARIVFIGDELENHVMLVWHQDEPQPTVEQHAINMKKLMLYRDEFDYICSGHSQVMGSISLIYDCLEGERLIMEGKEGEPFTMPKNAPADFYMPQIEFKRKLTYKDIFIIYDMRYIFNRHS